MNLTLFVLLNKSFLLFCSFLTVSSACLHLVEKPSLSVCRRWACSPNARLMSKCRAPAFSAFVFNTFSTSLSELQMKECSVIHTCVKLCCITNACTNVHKHTLNCETLIICYSQRNNKESFCVFYLKSLNFLFYVIILLLF